MDLFSQVENVSRQGKSNPYRESFQQELAKLNPEQRKAVETIEGPVLVIAGPGTGKTQILAARIGFILENTDTSPDNILCLTYTEAGAIAMRKRLLQFIGPEAYRLTISTFHAFCNNIIQDNLDLFGIHDLELISDLEVNEIIRSMIDDFPLNHPLKRISGDAYFEHKRMRDLFSLMKREGWTPDYICAKADEYIASLPDREDYRYKTTNKTKGYKTGDVKHSAIRQDAEKIEQLKAAAREFPAYVRKVMEKKRYDFDDMLLWMRDVFDKNTDLLLNYQERYHYVLVDEYQDTNGIQNQILQQLTGYWEVPNVFVVGDDDQSIFRFQGANVQNIMQFREQFKDSASVILITENYRSSQKILDTAKVLIGRNRERLINAIPGLNKDLVARGETASFDAEPEIREYPSVDYETVHIAQEIMRLKEEGVPPGSIAVLYRRHKQGEDLARFLEANDVTVNIRRRANVLNAPLVNHLITILQYIDAETKSPKSGEHLLFDILHFNIFNINPLVIARLALEIRGAKNDNRPATWREAIRQIPARMKNELFGENDEESFRAIKKLSEDLEYWIREAKNITLQQLLEKIVTRGGVLRHIMQSPDKMWLMQELTTFFNFVKSESAKNPRITVSRLVEIIRMMQHDEIELPINKISYSESGVNLLTAHSSKGLEFDYVFLMGCTRDAWEKGGSAGGYKLPDNLVKHYAAAGDELEEARRLFYVAMTRAKKFLYISYHTADKNMVDQPECRFVGEIVTSTALRPQKIEVSDEALLNFHRQMMTEEKPPQLELAEEAAVRKALEDYSLSVTHLNEYLRCPVSFYFKYVLKVPTAKHESLAFGSAVHFALEQLFRKMQDNKRFPSVDEFLSDFVRSMHRQEDSFTPDQFRRRLEFGKQTLTAYYHYYLNSWNTIISSERKFFAVVNGVPIKGQLDKVEFVGKLANVVDYKTGEYKNGRSKLLPLEGDYWRQAVFYRILIENDKRVDWKFASAEIDFIQPDKDGMFHKERITVDDFAMNMVKDQIVHVYNSIMNLEFKNGCGENDCDWCNFVRSRYQSVPEGEELSE
ncbi:MAG TPA: ATP-dependent DNA helicase [Chitinophagales bacterium]|nr:ATP-dependent DNA helicase [Chitinophagales bacterium]